MAISTGTGASLGIDDSGINIEDGAFLKGTSEDDEIENYGSNVTIDGDFGNDYIHSTGNNNFI